MDKKTLLAEYEKNIRKVWSSEKMVDYCLKKVGTLVELDGGDIAEIEKPHIETSFCFGYGYCGVSTEEDRNRASRCANVARTQIEYFIEENLKPLKSWLETLKDQSERIYKFPKYMGLDENDALKEFSVIPYYRQPSDNMKEISENERKALISGYEEVIKAFTKRLNTYAKKYGTSKLKVWTYLSD